MRISLVETNATGGLIHFAYQLGEALAADGDQVTIVTGRDYELSELPHSSRVAAVLRLWPQFDPAEASPLKRSLRRMLRPLRRAWRGALTVREWTRLTVWLLRERPDVAMLSVIHFPFQIVFLVVLRAAGIPLAQICHEFEQREARRHMFSGLRKRVFSQVYKQFDAIVFVSKSTEQDFLAAYGEGMPTFTIPHGPQLLFSRGQTPDIHARYGLGPADRVVLFLGGLRPSKGILDLITAFSLLPAELKIKLIIAGYPSRDFDTRALLEGIRRLGIQSQVFCKFEYVPHEEIAPLLSLADVAVFPYRSATASGAVALAQTMRRPVVATSVGGLPEAIEDGVSGWLVPPGDPVALAAAIAEVLRNPAEARARAERAHTLITEQRSWAEVAKAIRLIF